MGCSYSTPFEDFIPQAVGYIRKALSPEQHAVLSPPSGALKCIQLPVSPRPRATVLSDILKHTHECSSWAPDALLQYTCRSSRYLKIAALRPVLKD